MKPSSIIGTNKGVAKDETVIDFFKALIFFVYIFDWIVVFVPITPILQLDKFEATLLATGSITLNTGIFSASFFRDCQAVRLLKWVLNASPPLPSAPKGGSDSPIESRFCNFQLIGFPSCLINNGCNLRGSVFSPFVPPLDF